MLLQKETLVELRERFKLNIYEIKIWVSLLGKGIAAASDLAEISGVPRSRCYDVLESLEKKGFIIMKIGKPIKYIAIQPEAVVERVQKRLQEEAGIQIKSMEKLSETDIFKELELLHKTGVEKIDINNVTGFIDGRSNVNRFIKEMMLKAKKNITIFTNDEGIKNKSKILKKIKDSLAKKKVKVRLYTNASNAMDINELRNFEVIATSHNGRLVTVDNEEIFFVMANEDPEQYSGVWIKSPYFVSALSGLFEKRLE